MLSQAARRAAAAAKYAATREEGVYEPAVGAMPLLFAGKGSDNVVQRVERQMIPH